VAQTENTLQSQKGGGFSLLNGLKADADFFVSAGSAVVSTVTLGHVHISAPFCGFGWASDAGGIYGTIALLALGGGVGDAAEIGDGAETVDEVEAGSQAASSDSRVLLDTNAVIRFNDAQALIAEGEEPVVTQSVVDELADVAARKGFSGQLPAGVGIIDDDDEGALLRSQVMQQLRGFGAAEQGIDVDAQVGATALSRSYPLITGDEALGNSVAKLGGEWRQLP
jgi:predicted nucleic acid-binding protein